MADPVAVGFVITLLGYNKELRLEQQRALQAQTFLVDVLSSADPFRPADPELGRNITVVEALDLGLERLDDDVIGDPELKASIMSSIAAVYASLDQHSKAIKLQEEALGIQRELYGDESEQVYDSLELLGTQYLAVGDYERAAALHSELVAVAAALFGTDHPGWGEARAAQALLSQTLGDSKTAKAQASEAVSILRQEPKEYARSLINALLLLSNLLRFEENATAMNYAEEAYRLAEDTYGSSSLSMALVLAQRATSHSAAGRYPQAEADFKASIAVYEDRIGRDHGATLTTVNNLGILYNRMGRHGEASEVFAEVLERYRGKYGESHRATANAYQNLATALTRSGRYDESIPMHQKAFDIYRDVLTYDQPVVAYPLLSKAYAEVNSGAYQAAMATAKTALDILERTADGSYVKGVARCLIARSQEGLDDPAAEMTMAEAHELLVGSAVADTYRRFCRLP